MRTLVLHLPAGIATALITALAAAAVLACSGTTEPAVVGSVIVTPAADTLAAGAARQLSALAMGAAGDTLQPGNVIWSSSDPTIASVSASGLVTGIRSGPATITALIADQRGTAVIHVERRFKAAMVAVGPQGICALDAGGQAWCFGANAGLGTSGLAHQAPTAPVLGGHHFRTISVNYFATCALDLGGQAWCWGYGDYGGGLGDPTISQASVPVLADAAHTYDTLSAAGAEACGLSAGAAWCWGGAYGHLAPLMLSNPGPLFAGLALGTGTDCGRTTGGTVLCWTPAGSVDESAYLNSGYQSVAAGGSDVSPFVCGLRTDGGVECQGDNTSGQLGNGSVGTGGGPVTVAGGHQFAAITAGLRSACGVTATGQAYCWGANDHGQLGTGDSTSSSVPVAVAGGFSFRTVAISAGTVSAGGGTEPVCGITSADDLVCWGQGWPPRPTPVTW